MGLTLTLPDKLQPYGLYVYYVVHICDFGMLNANECVDSPNNNPKFKHNWYHYKQRGQVEKVRQNNGFD